MAGAGCTLQQCDDAAAEVGSVQLAIDICILCSCTLALCMLLLQQVHACEMPAILGNTRSLTAAPPDKHAQSTAGHTAA